MTKYRVFLSKTALSQLNLLDYKQKRRVKKALRNLEENPFQRRTCADIKKLVSPDEPFLFRLRIGDYRAIYFIVKNQIKVTEIIHRSKGYKWLE